MDSFLAYRRRAVATRLQRRIRTIPSITVINGFELIT
jgi:hypothetical protein